MTDSLKESLSALIDGEASEIEVHRLLRRFDTDATLKPSWINYLHVRGVARSEGRLSPGQHLALHERISAAIREEADFDEVIPSHGAGARFLKPAAGLGIAAALVAAVLVGVNLDSGAPGTDSAVVSAPATVSAPPERAPVEVRTVMNDAGTEPPAEELELKELDEEKQRALRAYLNQHDRMARMNPNARTVIFENPNSN